MSTNENTATSNTDVQATPATKRVTAELGSLISGTMRLEDLIPAFIDRLDNLKLELALSAADPANRGCELEIKTRVGHIDITLGHIESHLDEGDNYFQSENAGWNLEALCDALNEFAPDGCYFGAHPGDGCDYGFWQGEGDSEGDSEVSCDQCQMTIDRVVAHLRRQYQDMTNLTTSRQDAVLGALLIINSIHGPLGPDLGTEYKHREVSE